MLQVCRLEKIIDNRSALSIDDLTVAPGEIVTVIGHVGSGKSLLIRLLSGLLMPGTGKVLLDGQDVHHSQEARKKIGVLFEEDLLYERHTAQGNLQLYCQLHRLPANRINEALELVGLSDQARKPVSKLSPTAQRRLAFARALIGRPSLLLLDRPALRVDQDTLQLFARLIKQQTSQGTAVLLTDEDLAWAGKFSTSVLELEDGRIISSRVLTEDEPDSRVATGPEQLRPYRVPVRKDDRILLYDPGDILYATSRDGKTYLRTANEEATTNLTLQELETRLSGRGFFKAHRAYLVNLQHIKAVIQYTRNSYTLQLNDKDETMIPLSKQSEKELQSLLGY